MKYLSTLSLACILSLSGVGCATSLPVDNRSAEQIAASAKDKSMTGTCTRVNSPWGVGVVVQFQVDATVVKNGAVTLTENCGMAFSNAPNPQASASGQAASASGAGK